MQRLIFTIFVLAVCAAGVTVAHARGLKKIGVQLYTVRADLERDFDGTLKRVAALGYDEVEFAGLFGHKPREVRELVEKLGMKVVSSHIGSDRLVADPASAIEETKALGAKYMVLAWFPPEQRKTLDQWRNWVALMNRVGKMCRAKGIQFLYHNHNFEFEPIDGVVPFDLVLDSVDRRYVKFELDIYWLKLGGRDPQPIFRKYPGGFPLSHVKDMSKTDSSMADVGDGRIGFGDIFADSATSGMRHYFVEHDSTKAPYETLERSLKYLRGLKF